MTPTQLSPTSRVAANLSEASHPNEATTGEHTKEFAPPQFAANEICTPWLLFDDRANALVVSPASHYMVATMLGDGRQKLASGLNPELRNLPPGFSYQTVLAFGQGINRTWDLWGRAVLRLAGAKRPGQDADVVLKYLGYWTDNGASYYYNYDPERGYAGTLKALVERYRAEQIPLHYLQLDSWWYCKSTTGADGKPGPAKKVEKLPEGEWNRYGGTLQYCMPYACYFLQGCRYPNLTTIRTSTERFGPSRWNDFLYTSRLASALGLWPWSDVYNSSERNNVMLSTLSAGPVGVGDAIGAETKTNLVRAVREDGVIVKPDAPIVPTDSTYLADARNLNAPTGVSPTDDRSPLQGSGAPLAPRPL